LITSIVFQSDTANRALFPSRTKTPAYICKNVSSCNTCKLKSDQHHSEHLHKGGQSQTLQRL
jgi:hypothetical protein